jgi:hypothetical protein
VLLCGVTGECGSRYSVKPPESLGLSRVEPLARPITIPSLWVVLPLPPSHPGANRVLDHLAQNRGQALGQEYFPHLAPSLHHLSPGESGTYWI